MNLPLAMAFLFAVGAMGGWVIEFFYRNLVSHKGPRGRYFINPGFCEGPYLPIYGIGLTAMCLISYMVEANGSANTIGGKILVILGITVCMTVIEFIGGFFLLKVLNLRLWDYREEPGNIMGIICPKFTIIWGAIGAAYYLFLHKTALGLLAWLSQNLAFSFSVGLFFGIFGIDLICSAQKAAIVKQFGDANDLVVRYEQLKADVQQRLMESNEKQHFFGQTTGISQLADTLDAEKKHIEEKLGTDKEALEAKVDAFKRKRNKNRKHA